MDLTRLTTSLTPLNIDGGGNTVMSSSSSPSSTSSSSISTDASLYPGDANVTADDFLRDRNLEHFSSLIPFLAYLALLMLTGLAGNSVVFVVYYSKFRASSSRSFILSMSLCDLTTNALALLSEVLDLRFSYTFYAAGFCKLSKTFMGILVLFSGLVLVAVALERQKVVCGNFTRNQSGGKMVRVALISCSAIAVVLSLPRAELYGSHSASFQGTNVTGVQCSIQDKYLRSYFPLVYSVLNALVFVVIVVIMAVCYGRVAFHLWQHNKKAEGSFWRARTSSTSSSSNHHGLRRGDTESFKLENDDILNQQQQQQQESNTQAGSVSYQASAPHATTPPPWQESQPCKALQGQEGETTPGTPSQQKSPVQKQVSVVSGDSVKMTLPVSARFHKSSSTGKRIPSSTTLMLFVLTALFVLNFLPYLIVEAVLALAPRSPLWEADINALFFLFRSYYLNSAINPFVYSFFSAKFRYESRRLFQNLWRRARRMVNAVGTR